MWVRVPLSAPIFLCYHKDRTKLSQAEPPVQGQAVAGELTPRRLKFLVVSISLPLWCNGRRDIRFNNLSITPYEGVNSLNTTKGLYAI